MKWEGTESTELVGARADSIVPRKHQFVQENLMQMFCEFKSCAPDQWVDSRVFSNAYWALDLNPCMPPRMWRFVSTETGLIGLSEADLGGKSQVEIETLQLLSWMMIPWQSKAEAFTHLVKRNFNLIIFDFKMSPPNPTNSKDLWESSLLEENLVQPWDESTSFLQRICHCAICRTMQSSSTMHSYCTGCVLSFDISKSWEASSLICQSWKVPEKSPTKLTYATHFQWQVEFLVSAVREFMVQSKRRRERELKVRFWGWLKQWEVHSADHRFEGFCFWFSRSAKKIS